MTLGKLLYDSFNARYLNNEEIANLFIVNRQYSDLVKTNHSLLMGPRGSGKTTLMKMLTSGSQFHWKENNPGNELLAPSFYAIYVPTDVQWKKQIDEFEKEFSDKPRYSEIITRLLVTTHVLISLCDTFYSILEFKGKNESDLENEAILSGLLIYSWQIAKPVSANLLSVRHALKNRITEINSHKKKVATLDIPESNIVYPDYFYLDYYDLVASGVDAFEITFKDDPFLKKSNWKWALCFDELEIAPKWLQIELLTLLRSTRHQNILFKLTMLPLVFIEKKDGFEEILAREDQDFQIIRTWTFSKESITDWVDFSRRLVQDKFRRSYNGKVNPITLFGKDSLDLNIAETFKVDSVEVKNGYTEGSLIWLLFKELAFVDKSFRDFLKEKEINPTNPVPTKPKQEDEIYRKVKAIAVHRYQFRSHVVFGKKRSRKNPALYYGVPFIYHFCDGNPRALIGIIDSFINIMRRNEKEIQRFHISVQSRLIYNNSRKYLEDIYNHPDSNVMYLNKYINLGALLDKIGNYFHDKIIQDDFNMDPHNCFVVDRDIPEQIISLLTVAMHLGAIIYLDPQESISKNSMVGKKFRLSYFLFPQYQLPTVTYKEIQLSKILRKGTDKIDQLLLFDPK